ncbi:ATP-dependent helicase [Bermanella sp. R86510]|uniref:ATP-dependent helicase n=1 Tax=unclassified Bermanella TaxID=2627862 RepID=UPI0037C78EE1
MGSVTFTPQQQAVIEHDSGHAKVVAVAGAGKTTTLAHFILNKLNSGQNPKRLLVIMYNKSAQVDFVKKLSHVGTLTSKPQVRTFHALGLRIYYRLIDMGCLPAFVGDPLSQAEQEFQLWRLMQQCAPSQRSQEILQERKKWVDPMMSFVEQVKSCMEPPAQVFKQMALPDHCRFFVKTYEAFEQWRLQNRRITYADMLYDPCMLFSKRSDIAQGFANHMDWILVDEYQDINAIQQFLLQTLAGQRANVMVIGDPDQTIYEYRGSSSEYMVRLFDEQFPQTKQYSLTTSFRYGHEVALLASSFIKQNQQRIDTLCLAHDSNPDTHVKIHTCIDEIDNMLAVIKQASDQYGAENVAILYRLWGMSAPLELALLQQGIAYDMPSHHWVLDRTELQNFMFLFELCSGDFMQRDVTSQYRMLLQFLVMPALKIKRAVLDDIAKYIAQQLSLSENTLKSVLGSLPTSELSQWQQRQLEDRLMFLHLTQDKRLLGYQLVNRYVREVDFYKGLSDGAFSKQQADDRIATVQGFLRFMAKVDLPASQVHQHFLALKERKKAQQQKGVCISSIHRAKGLEWPVVIIPSVQQNYYPYQSEGELQQSASVESERRLFYVAMTRARAQLHIFCPSHEHQEKQVSEFIELIAMPSLIELKRAQQTGQPSYSLPKRVQQTAQSYAQHAGWKIEIASIKPEKPSLSKTQAASSELVTSGGSQRVKHSRFGNGVVVKQTSKHLHIRFEDGNTRVLDQQIAAPYVTWFS